MSPHSQKAKLIARLQTYVPLYDWPLLDELAESARPSEHGFIDARIAWVELATKKGFPAPGRDELAAFYDGYKAACSYATSEQG